MGGAQTINNGRLVGYFNSENVFNLSHKVLSEVEIKVLGKGLQFVPTSSKIVSRKNFDEFNRRMRNKWHFRENITAGFSEILAFRSKTTWTPPKGCASLEVFLSRVEKELFKYVAQRVQKYNLSKNQWRTLKMLIEDNSIIIKLADKGSCAVVWDRDDYLAEGYSQLSDSNVYTKIESSSEKFVSSSNSMFNKLHKKYL